jgi:hypothetical protein
MRMPQQDMLKGLNEDVRGMKDPGTALIIVYVCVVFFLLLFACLESARADLGGTEEKLLTMDNAHQVEPLVSAHEQGRLTADPKFSENAKARLAAWLLRLRPPQRPFWGWDACCCCSPFFWPRTGKNARESRGWIDRQQRQLYELSRKNGVITGKENCPLGLSEVLIRRLEQNSGSPFSKRCLHELLLDRSPYFVFSNPVCDH